MPSVIESRATWGDLVKGLSAEFAEVFNQSMESYSLALNDAVATPGNKATSLFKMRTSDKAEEKTVVKTGTGYLQYTSDGDDYYQDSRMPAYKTEYVFKKFTNSVTVTEEALADKAYSDKLDEFADLTVSGKETMDKLGFGVMNYGFTAQASIPQAVAISMYGDALPLCSIKHTRKDGGSSQSNASSTGIVLSETNLETARLALMNQLDDRGKPMRVGTNKLILLVPPALEKTAVVATRGDKRSGTANNDINIYDGLMTTIVSQWISSSHGGSDTAWFLIDPRVAKLIFWLRKGLGTSRYIDNGNKNVTFDISARWTQGWSDWRGLWGSLGDGAAYAL